MSGEECAKREKYRHELNAHERVERMRGVVRSQGNEIKELKQQLRSLMKHSHNNGEITVPLKDRDRYETGPGEFMRIPDQGEKENVYF